MNPDQLAELKNDDVLRKRMAKWMARLCFRNIKGLENMHAADQIDNLEMKALMVDVVDHCYAFLVILCNAQGCESLFELLKLNDQLPQWDEPEMPRELIEASKHALGILSRLKGAATS